MPTRDLDIVLFGATGFTGALTAEYLARRAPTGVRWALAGRNPDKLASVRDRLTEVDPGLADLELLVADASDQDALTVLAQRTKVVATTVGPYLQYGEPLVAACAAAGTGYVDITGEAEFVDRVYVAHQDTAVRTGARIVHACGFDSIPHDLGAYFTVRQLPSEQPIALRGVVRAGGVMSGGTFHTAVTAASRARQLREAAAARRAVESRPERRTSWAVRGKPGRDPVLGYWLLPLPTIDPLIVARSGRALPAYGPEFRYSAYAGMKTLPYAVSGAAVATGVAVAAQVTPLRNLLLGRMQPGQGPDEARRDKSWFKVDFIGEAGDTRIHTRVSGGDPGYGETAMMLGESALCLTLDDNPDLAGQLTTAQAMGDHLLDRLQKAGLGFENIA